MKVVKFIDIFAGLGGMRIGFEKSFNSLGFNTECVLTSEIKGHAITCLCDNFDRNGLVRDIRKISTDSIPEFDFLLAGFPCQPFSFGGNRMGFEDVRGTLFFEIVRILREKRPYGFILENVEGLIKHDLENKGDKIGRTLAAILSILRKKLGYNVSWKLFDSKNFGLPQSRKRIFIVGTKESAIDLDNHITKNANLESILESGLVVIDSTLTRKLLENYSLDELKGKSIKDKRGGYKNIHSWDIGLKGVVTKNQKLLLNKILKERRKRKWAKDINIEWMDGMPLTLNQIKTFHKSGNIKKILDDLVYKGYLKMEHPKKLVTEKGAFGNRKFRTQDKSKTKGYNIVTGNLSFEINKILDPQKNAPTIVATDANRLAVVDKLGLRRLSVREGLRLFGYPEWYKINNNHKKAFDLLGNTVPIPIVEHVSRQMAQSYKSVLESIKFNL